MSPRRKGVVIMRRPFRSLRVVASQPLPDDPLADLWRTPAAIVQEETPPARGRFTTSAEALQFIMAGKAIVTLQSQKTGTHYTYRIWRPKDSNDDVAFVSVLGGPDNTNDYRYLGVIRRGVFFHGRRTPKPGDVGQQAPSAIAWRWSYERLVKGEPLGDLIVMHEGQCGRCSRRLTNPVSIVSGIGPECAGRLGVVS